MEKYYVRMEELDINGDGVISSAEKMLYEINNMKRAIETMEWEGQVGEYYKETVNKKINEVSKIYGLYNVFGKFMKKTSTGFIDVNKNIEKGFIEKETGTNDNYCHKCGALMVNGVCLVCQNNYRNI